MGFARILAALPADLLNSCAVDRWKAGFSVFFSSFFFSFSEGKVKGNNPWPDSLRPLPEPICAGLALEGHGHEHSNFVQNGTSSFPHSPLIRRDTKTPPFPERFSDQVSRIFPCVFFLVSSQHLPNPLNPQTPPSANPPPPTPKLPPQPPNSPPRPHSLPPKSTQKTRTRHRAQRHLGMPVSQWHGWSGDSTDLRTPTEVTMKLQKGGGRQRKAVSDVSPAWGFGAPGSLGGPIVAPQGFRSCGFPFNSPSLALAAQQVKLLVPASRCYFLLGLRWKRHHFPRTLTG